jgi:hypothetical protein
LQEILPDFPPEIPVLFQAWPAVQLTPDVIPAKIWNSTLAGRHGRWLGGDPLHFPSDFSTIVQMTPAIEEWSQRHAHKLQRSLRLDELNELRTLLVQGPEPPAAGEVAGMEQGGF